MELEVFKEKIKVERDLIMPNPYTLTMLNFEKLNLNEQNEEYFFTNASYIMEKLRETNWNAFSKLEDNFSNIMYEKLINPDDLLGISNEEAIKYFVKQYPQHIYALSLSNTQSRRSRAGKEFEAIIELILMGANIPFDTQGSIGSGIFETKKLSKIVDCVSPGTIEYITNKRKTSLISAKTTLRERWQEVGDEMSRTKAREMYLVTLDRNISPNVANLIHTNNIVLVTTKSNKAANYNDISNILTVEDMLRELRNISDGWKLSDYTEQECNHKLEKLTRLRKQEKNNFIRNYYKKQLDKFTQI